MGGETDDQQSSWTSDLLKIHLQTQIDELKARMDERASAQTQAIQAALLSAEKAVSKAEAATEKRFDSVNEFRAQLADQAGQFMPREVAEAQSMEFRNQISTLTSRLDAITAVQVAAQRSLAVWLTVAALVISAVVVIANILS